MIESAEEFVRLRRSADPQLYERAARDTAPDQVWREVIERFPEMRRWVAQNKTVPAELLRRLAADQDDEVRWTAASRRNCPPEVLEQLAADPDETVRARVASNPKTSAEALRRLVEDPSPVIAALALQRVTERT